MEQEKSFNVFHAIVAAFYSKKLYRDIVQHWHKKTFVFVLLAIIILLCPFTIRFILNTEAYVYRVAPGLIAQLPVVSIANGTATVKPPGVHFISYPGMSYKLAVIDTEGSYKNFAKDEAMFLLSSHSLQMKTKVNQVKVYTYEKNFNFVFGPEQLKADLAKYKTRVLLAIILAIYTVGLVFCYIAYFIYALLIGVFASIIAGSIDRELSYNANLRLTAVAILPGAFLWSLLYLFHAINFVGLAIGLILQIIYIGYAVWSSKEILQQDKK